MTSFKSIYIFSFYIITFLIFVIGGSIQFLLGFSNTVLTFFLTGFIFCVYGIYSIHKHKLVLNKIVLFAALYSCIIIITALVRKSDIISTVAYLIFPLLPLGVYLFAFINYKEDYISKITVFKVFFYISLIQLPVLIAQIYFYDFLILFNNSGQRIAWFDFMFGTFFIKSDHSLGIFILIVVSTILFSEKKIQHAIKYPKISIIYLGTTLFLTQSNISKVLFILLILGSVLGPFYKKYKGDFRFKALGIALVIFLISIGYSLKEEKFVQRKLGGTFEKQFSLQSAEKFYEDTTAKRFQILIVAAKVLKTKWIGDGPYSYFDVRTGKFKQTKHFTQLIWTYFDLGIIGLVVVFFYMFYLISYLDIDKGIPFLIFTAIFLLYALYTTILSDIAILFAIFTVFNKRIKQAKISSS